MPVLLAFLFVGSASAQPRVIGHISPEDVAGVTAAIRTETQNRIVEIRVASVANRVGVQTESGPSAGCRYLVQRTDGVWKIVGKSCWTHTVPPPDAPTAAVTNPEVTVHVSQHDLEEIRTLITTATQEPIMGIHPVYADEPVPGSIPAKAYRAGPIKNGHVELTPITRYERTDEVSVMTGYREKLTGGSYLVAKTDGRWTIQHKSFWIH